MIDHLITYIKIMWSIRERRSNIFFGKFFFTKLTEKCHFLLLPDSRLYSSISFCVETGPASDRQANPSKGRPASNLENVRRCIKPSIKVPVDRGRAVQSNSRAVPYGLNIKAVAVCLPICLRAALCSKVLPSTHPR